MGRAWGVLFNNKGWARDRSSYPLLMRHGDTNPTAQILTRSAALIRWWGHSFTCVHFLQREAFIPFFHRHCEKRRWVSGGGVSLHAYMSTHVVSLSQLKPGWEVICHGWMAKQVSLKGHDFIQTRPLDIKVFFKETDTHALLCKTSFHPRHTYAGLVKSQLLRFHSICTKQADSIAATKVLFTALSTRGYCRSFLREVLKTFKNTKRKWVYSHLSPRIPPRQLN